ncbi:MAG: helix-turn-helix domain-containing protein [Clostridia bacterium]
MARKKLREYRISINKTQEEMAQIWGITVSFYKQIECGAKNPSIQKIKEFKNKFPTANTDEIFLS